MTDRHVSPKVHRDPPTRPQPWLDPDPLSVEPEPVDPRVPYHGWELEEPTPHWFAWLGLGVCIGIILLALVIVAGEALAAAPLPSPERPVPVPGRTGAPSVAPSLVATGGGAPMPAVPRGAPEPIGSVLANHDDGRHGTWAYANASHGSRYLAIPEGPGWIVEVCGPIKCIERVSTDAGPELWLQRAGRIGDLSSSDFEAICGPLGPGLCRGGSYTILGAADQSGDDPPRHPDDDRMRVEDLLTLPPTDLEPVR